MVEMENPTLDEDVLLQILSWLPKKYLYRFKCLSKRWNALISSLPRFPQRSTESGFLLQTNLLPTRLRANFFRVDGDGDAIPDRSLTFVFDGNSLFIHPSKEDEYATTHRPRSLRGDFSIAASCDGLLLLRKLVFGEACFYVYDPSSNLFESLPPPPRNPNTDHVGFAVNGSHYKVVFLSERPQQHRSGGFVLVFHIFCSLTIKWRETVVRSFSPKLSAPQAVFVGGHLYWLGGGYLLVFRFRDERHLFVELPDQEKRFLFPRNGCIWEAEGCLQYCDCIYDRIRIWVLCSDGWHDPCSRPGFRWQLKHDVVPRFGDSPSLYVCDFKRDFFPCGFNDDFGVVFLWFKRDNGVLLSCNLGTGVLRKLSRCRPATPHAFIPFFYGESNSVS